jgi:hypothetical protein
MAQRSVPPIEVFRATLQRVEQESGLALDDPSLLELRRIFLSRIAKLESANTEVLAPPDDAGATPAPTLDPALEPVLQFGDVTPLLAQGDPEPPNSGRAPAVPDKLP